MERLMAGNVYPWPPHEYRHDELQPVYLHVCRRCGQGPGHEVHDVRKPLWWRVRAWFIRKWYGW